jgi:hypothetical protein
MWIFGLLAFYFFYRFFVVWYLRLFWTSRLERAYYWSQRWYHIAVWSIAAFLLALSAYLFSRKSVWLVVVPFVLLLLSIYFQRWKQSQRLNETIKRVVLLNHEFTRQGQSRSVINRRLVQETLSEIPSQIWVAHDWDVPDLLKSYILPRLGLYQVDIDLENMYKPGRVMLSTQIDAAIEYWQHIASMS